MQMSLGHLPVHLVRLPTDNTKFLSHQIFICLTQRTMALASVKAGQAIEQ